MQNYNFIISGGSITNSIWLSWKDFVLKRYGIRKFINNAYAGVGNEFIIDSTINHCQRVSNPFVLVMLTNIDKWDWYIEKDDITKEINQIEKHPVRNLNGDIALNGFWSTGSWFPKYKEYYKNYYYSEKYFAANTLKHIFLLQKFLSENHIPNIILFDSPILDCTEQDLNTGKIIHKNTQSALSRVWANLIDWSTIYKPGLIGFCEENKLDWYSEKHRGHPPTKSHWEFSKCQIFPILDNFLTVVDRSEPTEEINKFQQMFYL